MFAFSIALVVTEPILAPLDEWCYTYLQDHIYLNEIICKFIQEIQFVIDILILFSLARSLFYYLFILSSFYTFNAFS